MLKKGVRIILAIIITFVMVFAGCGQKDPVNTNLGDDPVKSTPKPNNNEGDDVGSGQVESILPLTTNGETLRIAAPDLLIDVSMADNLPIFQELENRTGVKIIWEVDSVDYNTTMATRLAAAVDLPDMFIVPNDDTVKYANEGLIIPLNDLIYNHTLYMKKWYDAAPDIVKTYTTANGMMYSIPRQFNIDWIDLSKYNNYVFLVRKDWLSDLGLTVPQTLDEYYAMLKAFKDNDLNGNGIDDEIPFSGIGVEGLAPLGWMYGLHIHPGINNGFYPDSGGKIQYEWINPQTKELLATLNQWFKEGLIDPGFMSLPYDKYMTQIYNNVGATISFSIWPYFGWDATIKEVTGNPDAAWMGIPTPSGPYGNGIIEMATQPGFGHFAISKDCKNPELAIKWIDYACFSDDAVILNFYGLEGISFEYIDGKPVLLDEIKNSTDGYTVALQRLGALHSEQIPYLAGDEGVATIAPFFDMMEYGQEMFEQMKTAPRMIMTLPTIEETEELSLIMTDMLTYQSEMVAKFITGDEPLDNFDAFVNKLKEIGLNRVLDIKQVQYDRSLK
jgi:putative aldouronate transport system substrate-binding protein